MTHLKRFLWLAAWGVWLWLGFGLYRELPRDLGPVVRRLWTDNEPARVEFIGRTNRIVSIKPEKSQRGSNRALVEVFDADGQRVFSRSCPDWDWGRILVHPTLPLAFPDTHNSGLGLSSMTRASGGVNALDLTSGDWKPLTTARIDQIAVHPTKPLVAFLDHRWPTFVVLLGVGSGEMLLERELPPRFLLAAPPFFVGDDQIVLPLKAVWNRDAEDAFCFEVFHFGSSKPKKTVNSPPFSAIAATASTGRVALENLKQSPIVQVLDLEQNAVVFSSPNSEGLVGAARKRTSGLAISQSGDAVLGGANCTLWDVERGVALWRPGSWETARGSSSTEYFVVAENWSGLWSSFAPKFKYQSFAIRSLETGGLLWRQAGNKYVTPKLCNSAGTLAVLPNGTVHKLPLRIDWLLLVICQTILSLPLLSLWTICWWRRKRRMRLAWIAP